MGLMSVTDGAVPFLSPLGRLNKHGGIVAHKHNKNRLE